MNLTRINKVPVDGRGNLYLERTTATDDLVVVTIETPRTFSFTEVQAFTISGETQAYTLAARDADFVVPYEDRASAVAAEDKDIEVE